MLWKIFIAVLAATVAAELFIEKHPHFAVEGFFASYAIYGFVACGALILVAKALGIVLKRTETYYDE